MQVKILNFPGLALLPDLDVTPNQERLGKRIPNYRYEEKCIDPETGKDYMWCGVIYLTYYE